MLRTEQPYALAFEQNPLPMWVTDRETMRILDVNDAAQRQYGYTRDEFRALSLAAIRPPEELPRFHEHWRRMVETGTPGKSSHIGLLTHRRKDGTDIIVDITATPITFEDRAAFLSVAVDVTGRVRAEKEAREARERFEFISRAVNDTIWDLNLVTGEVWRSGNRGAVFGRGPDEVAPRMEGWSELVHPDDRERVVEGLHAVVKSGGKTWAAEYRFRRGDGTWGDMLDRAFVVHDQGGRAVRMVGSMVDISDRKRIDQELLDQRRRLIAIFENAQDGILISNEDNRFMDANPAACAMFGYTREELLELKIWDLLLKERSEEYRERMRRLKVEGRQVDEGQGRRKDGSIVEVEYRSVANIEPGVHLTVMRDITARKRADRELLQQKRRLQALFDHVSEGIFIFDDQGRFLEANPAACAMYGYPSEELLALNTTDLIFEHERAAYLESIEHMLETGSASGEGRGRRKDGTVVEVEYHSVGNIEPGVHFSVVRDITQRKHAEQKLFEQKRRLQALFDNATDGIVLTDDQGHYVDVNPAACALYGYSREEMLRLSIWDLALREEREMHRERFRRLLRDGRLSGEARRIRKDGRVIELEFRSVARIEPGVHLSTMRDITQHKLDEESLRSLSGRLLRLQDEERRRLARELHDSTAQSLAALALELAVVGEQGGRLNPRARHALAEAERLADACSRELRTLSYLLHPPLLDEMGLASALSGYVDGFSKRSGIQVQLDMPADIGRLAAETETTLFRIVQECLTNVHRHSMSPSARVQLVLEPAAIRLEVADQGRGLPAREADGSNGEQSELGVGLAGMKERVRQLGGLLELDSSGAGLTVRAILPRRPS